VSDAAAIERHFLGALSHARGCAQPFPHWLLDAVLPPDTCAAIRGLPIEPPRIADTDGKRDSHNASRRFLAADLIARVPACRDLALALASPRATAAIDARCGSRLRGSALRIEYCQDTDGFWLEPHTDISAKLFTMLVYLSDEPAAERWGTDLMTAAGDVVATAPCHAGAGLIFLPGADTWHGFRRRPITGVRRSLIVNYVTPDWRARHELAFPDAPIG